MHGPMALPIACGMHGSRDGRVKPLTVEGRWRLQNANL